MVSPEVVLIMAARRIGQSFWFLRKWSSWQGCMLGLFCFGEEGGNPCVAKFVCILGFGDTTSLQFVNVGTYYHGSGGWWCAGCEGFGMDKELSCWNVTKGVVIATNCGSLGWVVGNGSAVASHGLQWMAMGVGVPAKMARYSRCDCSKWQCLDWAGKQGKRW